MGRMQDVLKKIPEVKTVVFKAGRPEDGTDPKLISMAEILVDLKPESEWTRHVTKRDVMLEMDRSCRKFPAYRQVSRNRSATTFWKAFRRSTARSWSRFSAMISTCCATTPAKVLAAISDVPGVARAMIDRQGELPQTLIEIDRAQAARYGLNVADIEDVIETVLGGKVATSVWEGEKRFGIVVRLKEDQRALDDLPNILVTTPNGVYLPLSQVAKIRHHRRQHEHQP